MHVGALFSTVEKYLAALPEGIHSYPDSVVKGTIVRAVAEMIREDRSVRIGLPVETLHLIDEPPLVSEWIPEVHLNVMFSAISEARHAGRDSFETWAYEGNRRLFSGPIYRAVFGVLGPERIMPRVHIRWAAFRRGTTLSPIEMSDTGGTLRLGYEPYLMPEVALRAMRGAFRAVADATGAKQLRVTYDQESPTSTVFQVRWAR